MPRGNWTPKQERTYQHILKSCRKRKSKMCRKVGSRTVCEKPSKTACQRVAAATVNKGRRKRRASSRRSLGCGCGG